MHHIDQTYGRDDWSLKYNSKVESIYEWYIRRAKQGEIVKGISGGSSVPLSMVEFHQYRD